MRCLLLILLLVASAAPGRAADTRAVRPRSIEIQAAPDEQFGTITVRATAADDWEGQLTSLSLSSPSLQVSIPPAGLTGFKRVDLASVSLYVVLPDPAKPILIVCLRCSDPAFVRMGQQPARVEFIIEQGRPTSRVISWQTLDGRHLSDRKPL